MGDSKAAVTSKAHANMVMTHESFIHGGFGSTRDFSLLFSCLLFI